jgi:hypothetical protein
MSRHAAGRNPDRQYDGTGETVYEFEDGWTIRTVTTKNDLDVEGYHLMNFIYFSPYGIAHLVKNGEIRIFSLRDPQNVAWATVELTGVKNEVRRVEGQGRKNPAPARRELLGEWLQSISAFMVLRGHDDDISYRVWEHYDIKDAANAIGDYYYQENEDSFGDDEDFGIPLIEEIGWSDPDDVLEAVIDKYEQNHKSASDPDDMHTEYHQRKIEGLDSEWLDKLPSALVEQCERGEIGEEPSTESTEERKKALFERAAEQYYNLYQVIDDRGDWTDDKYPDEYFEEYGDLFSPRGFISTDIPRDYKIWAEKKVRKSPILQLCRAIIEALGQPVFPFKE